MAKPAKNILTLNHEEAMGFFMKSEQYHGLIDIVYNKLYNQPNSNYNRLCLQNMTYTRVKKKGATIFITPLPTCRRQGDCHFGIMSG